jgi:hypothetical protein
MIQTKLTVIGDRQEGKTRILIDNSISTAQLGGKVWFQTRDRSVGHLTVKQTVERIKEIDSKMIQQVSIANGHERIVFTSGGVIDFDGAGFIRSAQVIDLHCLDEVFGPGYTRAKRVIRTVLR